MAISIKILPSSVLAATATSENIYSVLMGKLKSVYAEKVQYERKWRSAMATAASNPLLVVNVSPGSKNDKGSGCKNDSLQPEKVMEVSSITAPTFVIIFL